MVNKILLLFLVSLSVFSQDEKRLALVIGNANYDKGELKNPVNDARLIASTLDSLDFDVILKENLSTKRDMTAAIREFGAKRSEYDVAFVYYAGHGIQVDDENFLLPTKEVFEGEFDVLDYGVSVQNIMRYLRAQTNEVNILILDACRDNPFESNWNTTRSLKSQGLAKIPPPSGSLIAFSTDSNQTAPDGDGDNSTYTISLVKNMKLENISIDQVFRNVRAEVLANTNGAQSPTEETKLTGQTFYLNKLKDEFFINKFYDHILVNDLKKALELINGLIFNYPENANFLSKRGHVNILLGNKLDASKDYKKAIQINPKQYDAFFFQIVFEEKSVDTGLITLSQFEDLGDENKTIENAIKTDINNPLFYIEKARYLNWDLGDAKSALKTLFQALEVLNKMNDLSNISKSLLFNEKSVNINQYVLASIYLNISYVYKSLGEIKNSSKYADLAISNDQQGIGGYSGWYYYQKAFILENQGNLEKSMIFYKIASEKMPKEGLIYLRRGNILNTLGDYKKANSKFNYAVKINSELGGNFKDLPLFFRSIFYYTNKKYLLALEDLNILENNSNYAQYKLHLIKALVYKGLGSLDLAKRDLKKYLLGCCFYDEDGGVNWFEKLVDNEDFTIPDLNFYKSVYANDKNSQINAPIPWDGNNDLIEELKFIIKYQKTM